MAFVYPDADGTVKGLLRSVNRAFQATPRESADGEGPFEWLPDSTSRSPASVIPAQIHDAGVSKLSQPAGAAFPVQSLSEESTKVQEVPRKRTVTDGNNPERSIKRKKTKAHDVKDQTYPEEEDLHDSNSSSDGPDWRRLLCSLVEAEADSDDATLVQGVVGIGRILRQIANLNKPEPPPSPPETIYTVLHRVRCDARPVPSITLDTDPPYVRNHFHAEWHLHSGNRVTNLDLYMERNQHASFVVFREYFCCSEKQKKPVDGIIEAQSEKLVVSSERLLKILLQAQGTVDRENMVFPDLKLGVELERPHLWSFFAMKHLESMEKALVNEEDKKHLALFLIYFRDEKMAEHKELESLLSQKLITPKFLEYLFIPGQLLLRGDTRGLAFVHAIKQVTWPEYHYAWSKKDTTNTADSTGLERKPEARCEVRLKFRTSRWAFSGNFQRIEREEEMFPIFVGDKPLNIHDFPLYPLARADPSLKTFLEERGKRFWTCRKRRYVEYSGAGFDGSVIQPKTRLMIDTEAFNQMVPPPNNIARPGDDLGPHVMSKEEPPEGDFVLLLPAVIYGFHMQDKKWQPLLVSNISDVVWDKDVFDTLVLPADTKDLIMALVTNKIAADQTTDFFSGKGTGLVILFHGPPGTGKTLTAESVAELANKPLYRVTCGDIGTNPEGVEKYLKHVLWLGKNWDCVVLLDEAEVFLQERAMHDIQRNALVSIFLRTLEYYDGILVLTSNRVGTFDEGFKSRIQLAIQYEKLTESSRGRVWENFINRLETFKSDDIDIRDLRRHLNDLAHYKMNGRQIRNAVTTGRQLAMFKKKPLDYECLKHVINVSSRFDRYLTAINEGMEDEDLAREDHFR